MHDENKSDEIHLYETIDAQVLNEEVRYKGGRGWNMKCVRVMTKDGGQSK